MEIVIGGLLLGGLVGGLVGFVVGRCRVVVGPEQALVILGPEPRVAFTSAFLVPVLNRWEILDISAQTILLARRGKEGLSCKDCIRADLCVRFRIRVNKTAEDVIKVFQTLGCARASDPSTLACLFEARFFEALKSAGKRYDFLELYTRRDEFLEVLTDILGKDLHGYVLDGVSIDFLEQTPLEALDPNNILDAEGIRKLTELAAQASTRPAPE